MVELGTQDLIEPGDEDKEVFANVFHRKGENIDRMLVAINSETKNWEGVLGHELVHLLGEPDGIRYPSILSSGFPCACVYGDDYTDIFGHREPESKIPRIGGGYDSPDYRPPSKQWESNIVGSKASTYEYRYSNGREGIYWGKRVQK